MERRVDVRRHVQRVESLLFIGQIINGESSSRRSRAEIEDKKREGKLTPSPLSLTSSLHRCQSPAPPKSVLRTRRSSKNRCACAQSPSCSSRASCSSGAYISWVSALSAATCRQGRGRTEGARRIPREKRRKPRWPCSGVWRRWKMQTPRWESFVK